jgi:hypothetical protein
VLNPVIKKSIKKIFASYNKINKDKQIIIGISVKITVQEDKKLPNITTSLVKSFITSDE